MRTETRVKVNVLAILAMTAGIGVFAVGIFLIRRPAPARPSPPPSVEQLTASLRSAIDGLWTTQPSFAATVRQNTLTQTAALAKQRRAALQALLVSDPARALRSAVLAAIFAKAPSELRDSLERSVTLEGRFEHVHEDDFQDNVSRDSFSLETGDKRYNLVFTGPPPDLRPGTRVRVDGLTLGDDLLVDSNDVAAVSQLRVVDPGIQVAPSGQKRVAVILFTLPTNRSQPWTTAQVRDVLLDATQSVTAYYDEASHGALTIAAVDVYGWYDLVNVPTDYCDPGAWEDAAELLAEAEGYHADDYDHTIYAFPYMRVCSYAGAASGNRVSINGFFDVPTIAHEFGHNYGFHHAGNRRCTDASGAPVPLSNQCPGGNEYGDRFDIMGGAYDKHHVGAYRKTFAGWFGEGAAVEVTGDGVFTLVPQEPGGPGIKSLRIPRLRDVNDFVTEWFYLEYRQPYGVFDAFPPSAPVVNGVSIRLGPDYQGGFDARTWLIDMNPSTSDVSDAPLGAGQQLIDPVSQVTILAASMTPSAATVRVTMPPLPPDTRPPFVTIVSPRQNELVVRNGTLDLEGSARDAFGVARIEWFIDDVHVHSCEVSGTSAVCPFAWTYTALAAGDHEIRLRTTDAAGNAAETSITVTVDLDLADGWPKVVPYFHSFRHLTAVERAAAPGSELVGFVWEDPVIYDAGFNPLAGWPVALDDGFSWRDAAVWRGADGRRLLSFVGDTKLHLYTGTGTAVPGWPQPLVGDGTGPAVIEDLDDDGSPEVIILTYDFVATQYTLQVRRLDGSLQAERRGAAAGWPPVFLAVGDVLPATSAPPRRGDQEIASASTSGKKILVAARGQGLHLFNATGAEIVSGSWPVALANVSQQPTLANLDGAGGLEVIVCTDDALHVLRPDGSELPGWPRTVSVDECPALQTVRQPVVADLDGDGTFEILTDAETSSMIRIRRVDGDLVAPIALPAPPTPQLKVVDVDGDAEAEILVATGRTVAAYKRSGAMVTGWPRRFPTAVDQLLADELDGDASNELLVTAGTAAYRFDLPSVAATQRSRWRYEYANPQRSAVLEQCGDGTAFGSCSTKTSGMRCLNGVLTSDTTCRLLRPPGKELVP